MNPQDSITLTILTATFNSSAVIGRLIASLEAQTDADFEWLVVDGASSDDTLARIANARLARKTVVSEPDFGVYDALNKGVCRASGDYYLVVGADDTLAPEAVANFRRAVAGAAPAPDLVSAHVESAGRDCQALRRRPWLYGMQAYVSAHSVGTLIRRDLHDRFGLYSRKFPIGADQYFIKRAAQGGARILYADFRAGSFSQEGVSSVDVAGTLTEFFRVQLATERGRLRQVLLFLLRLARHYRSL
ncbi:MAG TPA: glycosyltransferase [Moraxellaceae bacterium]|nr:glycosyltransferase [Moraxellaceae bacterium]